MSGLTGHEQYSCQGLKKSVRLASTAIHVLDKLALAALVSQIHVCCRMIAHCNLVGEQAQASDRMQLRRLR